MRAVLDTNVLVSGIFFGNSVPFQVVDLWLNGRYFVYATPAILEEYLRVIDRLSLQKEPALDHDWESMLPEICHIIPDGKIHKQFSRDPFDDKFLACAEHSGAQYLITGDKI